VLVEGESCDEIDRNRMRWGKVSSIYRASCREEKLKMGVVESPNRQ
jgi:hypothetical protein